ncbi:hypothetical protein QJS10_CPA09g01803 [Acorus calamus]|uniref:Uncharacterized protein n=1 Tax=Acorus calamus TaxID=4465 RepID=A0AAV9E7D4_ACOCL|nr:hypothetical protein QJS10_CPA09g01803 [Acorus calamus]
MGFSKVGTFFIGLGSADAKVGVNKPELLPKEFSPVLDVAGFLSSGQDNWFIGISASMVLYEFKQQDVRQERENRLIQQIVDLEKDTGYKLRILAQNFPDTPGLAIKDFWVPDDRTIVFVADPTFGNIIHFNVGSTVDLDVPRNFWSRVAGKYGNMFYWKEKGEDASIEGAVVAISKCLRDPTNPNGCSEIN